MDYIEHLKDGYSSVNNQSVSELKRIYSLELLFFACQTDLPY